VLQRLARWFAADTVTLATEPDSLSIAAIDATPAPHRFETVHAWLCAWIAWQLARHAGTSRMMRGPFGEGFVVGGTIGLLYAFATNGTLWIFRDWPTVDDASPQAWIEATANQRLAILIDAQRRVHPELAVLLPLRPHDASDCAVCAGRAYENVWCGACSNRGWTQAGLDTTLPALLP
jgi:hypothetical protein